MKQTKKTLNQKTPEINIKNKEILSSEGLNAYFANYFGIEISNDDCTLSFGQKLPSPNKENQNIYDIRRRIIMTRRGLVVLKDIIDKSLETLEKNK